MKQGRTSAAYAWQVSMITEEAAAQRALAPMTVLVVEDEEATLKLCADVAESCGMKPILASTVEEALRRLETNAVNIIVTDLILPPSSGLDLLKQVHEMYPEVAVVVLTQYGSIDSAVAATRMGAVDYVTKPFHIDDLRSPSSAWLTMWTSTARTVCCASSCVLNPVSAALLASPPRCSASTR